MNRGFGPIRIGMPAVLAAVLALLAVPGALAGQSVTDPSGDSGAAPDIGSVSASGDQSGNVVLTVATNEVQLDPNASFFAYLDTDSNAATGLRVGGLGAEYLVIADGEGALLAEVLGNTIFVHLTSTATGSYAAGIETIRVNRSDLHDASGFSYLVESNVDDGNGNIVAWDQAPDGPPYPQYSAERQAPLSLSLARPASLRGKPLAGKTFVVAASVTRSDGAVFSGTVSCRARVDTKSLRESGSTNSGVARCSMRVPKGTNGKRIRGTMSVSTSGAIPVTRRFAFLIG